MSSAEDADEVAALRVELARLNALVATNCRELGHDLRSPLTSLLGFLELLHEMPALADDARAATYLERCTSSARRMLAVVEDKLSTPWT